MGEPKHLLDCNSLLSQAARCMREALSLLDEAQAPSDIGALVDLALSRLGKLEASDRNDG